MTSHQFDLELMLNWLKPLFVGVLLLIEGLLSFLKKKNICFILCFLIKRPGKFKTIIDMDQWLRFIYVDQLFQSSTWINKLLKIIHVD